MGRPRFELTDEQRAEAGKLAAYLSLEQLADVLNVSARTLRRRLVDDPAFARAYKQGHAKAIAAVAHSLVQLALKGNVTACIFYLKAQAGWREADPRQIDVSDISKLPDRELERETRRMGIVKSS